MPPDGALFLLRPHHREPIRNVALFRRLMPENSFVNLQGSPVVGVYRAIDKLRSDEARQPIELLRCIRSHGYSSPLDEMPLSYQTAGWMVNEILIWQQESWVHSV